MRPRRSSRLPALHPSVLAGLGAIVVLAACGETRRPIGDECLRGDDCLSGVCSAGTCVSAPPLKVGANGPAADEEPDIGDASADAPSSEGG